MSKHRMAGAFLHIEARHAPWTRAAMRAFDQWDAAWRRKAGFFAGLSVHPDKGTIGLYRHWPHLLCWQWVLRWQAAPTLPIRALFQFKRFGPGPSGAGSWYLYVWPFGVLSYQRQGSDRIRQFGPLYADAPVIWPRTANSNERDAA